MPPTITSSSVAANPGPAETPRGNAAIKALAQRTGRTIPDLLALSRAHDPFFSGSPQHHEQAAWFLSVWQRFDYTTAVHLRRMHYQTFVQHDVRLPSGELYGNTEAAWQYFQTASRNARYLGLVDPTKLVDHRNPAPHLFAASRYPPEPEAALSEARVVLPYLPTSMPAAMVWVELPDVTIAGYDYDQADQPYHLEVWCEKSTMDDVLLPVCRSFGVNLVTSAGYQSITGAINVLLRTRAHGKPVRIFYISDFDSAGWGMPVQVSRQIEFWLAAYHPEADLRLVPVVLTKEQVDTYDLPNAPGDLKRSNVRFEARQSRGVVELDALEALHPGALARELRARIGPYLDGTLSSRLRQARDEAQAEADDAWQALFAPWQARLEERAGDVRAVAERFAPRQAALNAEFEAAIQPLREQIQADLHAVQLLSAEFEADLHADLPDRPEPVVYDDDDSDWLFDSSRDYEEQLAAYKQRAGSDDGEELAS